MTIYCRMIDLVLEETRLLGIRLRERQGEIAQSSGQSRASWQLLAAASGGGGTVPQLARGLGQSRQGVQRVADRLVEGGLATYESNPHHRRSPRLQLTERGAATLAALQREAARRAPDVEQDMEPEDLETTLYVLRALRDAL